ncbi:MAG: 2-succinyl-5-enolpyruvyl-6-hydroxy-3-cyclohexene-1-carboxylic-acid synthase, partial [Acidimicrobiales bacterium]
MSVGDGTLQAAFAATLVDEWVRCGVQHAVVAPGSRSTPMALAIAAASTVKMHVHLDERSAAFFAVGIGLATGRPAVLLCTSGTAAAEFHAAVVEAHQAQVPLIVCTADRPPELRGVSAPQTIDQDGLYGASTRWSWSPGTVSSIPPAVWRSVAGRAFAEAVANGHGPGPVHLNLGFTDPLVAEPGPVPLGRTDGRPWHRAERPPSGARAELAVELSGRRGVIVAGRRSGRHGLRHLAEALEWPVMADARSQARGWPQSIAAFDSVLRSGFDPGPVDVVLRVGEPPASKVLSGWLAAVDADQIVIDPYGRWPDPEHQSTLVVHGDPTKLTADLADIVVAAPADWLRSWIAAEAAAQSAIASTLKAEPEITEPAVARLLTEALPADVVLFASSSMPVRDLEWFGHPASTHRVHANRGANGIDGVTSTALGVAVGGGSPVVALLGDLAFLHDVGGLLNATRREANCVLVVVDNNGGGIFSFLPQA